MTTLQTTIDEYNAAIVRQGNLIITLPVYDETLASMAEIADHRGRADIATKLRRELYRRTMPQDEDIGRTV